MSRFVVLEHESPRGRHWDLMLETGPTLATWALPEPPNAADAMPAQALPDHRPEYLDYEGPISDGRGSVTRWDQGTCQLRRRSESEVIVVLEGEKLVGTVTLVRSPDGPDRWQFSYSAG